jgi:hypothetical protein
MYILVLNSYNFEAAHTWKMFVETYLARANAF